VLLLHLLVLKWDLFTDLPSLYGRHACRTGTAACTGTTCPKHAKMSAHGRMSAPADILALFLENFSPAFRGRLLGSYHSDQRAVKSKNAPFGLLFQISPLGTLWACPERLHVNKKAGQSPFPRPKKSISAPRGPTIPLQVCICSQKLSESSSITFKSLNRGLLAF